MNSNKKIDKDLGYKSSLYVYRHTYVLMVYLFVYLFINLIFLTDYPFVHSDESWLSGLTRNMMESSSLGVTEPFFDLKHRWPHAIKSLFHILQMPFIGLFGYSIFSFRLLSLLFSLISLICFYLFLQELMRIKNKSSNNLPLMGTILFSLNIQFIYASHFARQEIILLAGLLACALLIRKGHPLAAGIVTGLCIGIHPNSFIIGLMGVFLCIRSFKKNFRPVLYYVFGAGVFALFFVGLSFYWDRVFPIHYLQYGNSEFDVAAPVSSKIMEFPHFIEKIWYQVSGTYHLPDIRIWMLVFGITIPLGLILTYKTGTQPSSDSSLFFLYKAIAAVFLGMVIIGRYNQTSIVFFLPLLIALLLLTLQGFLGEKKPLFTGALIFLIVVSTFNSFNNISPWLPREVKGSCQLEVNGSYDYYLGEIASKVSSESRVLANLNTDYYFDNGNLRDVRNLTYLKAAGLSIEEYIIKNDIQYIIISDEMDFIYQRRPTWNMIYGNPRYMPELRLFTEEKCTLIHEFIDNTYGIRIVGYMRSDRDFTVQIFEVEDLF